MDGGKQKGITQIKNLLITNVYQNMSFLGIEQMGERRKTFY
jgi:hypothetical protein